MEISRNPIWINLGDNTQVFTWMHLPDSLTNNHAYIIVGAIGPEYMHTYRTIRLLADRLAETGCIAIRYDHIGMGNSSSNLEDQKIWNRWILTPGAIRKYIKNQFNIEKYTLIAFRSGSLIIESYLKEYMDEEIIFWYPYLRGAAFIRDMKVLDGITNIQGKDNETIDAGGYPLSKESQTELLSVNLLKTSFGNYKNTLVIENGELTSKSQLSNHLNKNTTNTETLYLHGLSALARQAALSISPIDNINSICAWTKKLPQKISNIKMPSQPSNTLVSEEYSEKTIRIGDQYPVFGILTSPTIQKDPSNLLILSNSGSGHHAGPNRFHVDTARQLAIEGISTFRMDLSNLGDSPDIYQQDNYHPYPITAADDLCAALEYFSKTIPFKNIILAGLCSGAHNAFHASLKTKTNNLCGLILINLITFYWKNGQSILAPEENEFEINASQYQSNLSNPKKWISILSSPSKLPRLAKFALRLGTNKTRSASKKILSFFGYGKNTKLDNDISDIISRNIKLHFLYSENEPTYKILMSQAASTAPRHIKTGNIITHKIKCTDHTFSSRTSKQELINSIISSVKKLINKK